MKIVVPEFLGGPRSELVQAVVSGSARVFIIQVVGLSLALALNVIWVRFLGPVSFGHYSFAISWVNILAVIGSMGWGTANVRLVPKLRAEGRLSELAGLIFCSLGISAVASLAVGGVYVLVIPHFYSEVPLIFHALTGVLVIPVSMLLVLTGVIKGLKNVAAAQLVHLIVRTLAMLFLVGLVWLFFPGRSSASVGLVINLVASLVSISLLLVFIRRFLILYASGVVRRYKWREWLGYSLPLVFIIGFNVINSRVGILATGMYLGPEATGQYAACVQISLMAGFGLMVVGMVAQPVLSELFSKNDFQQISVILKLTARGGLFLTVPITLVILVGGKWILAFMSETYAGAFPILVILTMGQIISVISGQVGTLLVMTNMQGSAMAILGCSVVLHILLLLFLVPLYGLMGAGISSGLTMVFWNLAMSLVVWRKFGLRATVI